MVSLREKGFRMTEARRRILEVFLSEHGPHSVDEIYRKTAPGVGPDRVTVYRTVLTLEKVGFVKRCDLRDGIVRYEWAEDEHHHHHVTCRNCRQTESLHECVPDALLHAVARMGYQNITHSLEFFGLCGSCEGLANKSVS